MPFARPARIRPAGLPFGRPDRSSLRRGSTGIVRGKAEAFPTSLKTSHRLVFRALGPELARFAGSNSPRSRRACASSQPAGASSRATGRPDGRPPGPHLAPFVLFPAPTAQTKAASRATLWQCASMSPALAGIAAFLKARLFRGRSGKGLMQTGRAIRKDAIEPHCQALHSEERVAAGWAEGG